MRFALMLVLAGGCGRIGFDAQPADANVSPRGLLGDPCDATRLCASDLACTGGACSCAIELRSDEDHSCALRADGTVWCWGDNTNGELGRGTVGGNSAIPDRVTGLPADVVGLDNGAFHSCVWTAAGQAWCWGRFDLDAATGQPYALATPTNVVEVAAGGYHACLRTATGQVWCVGRNTNGQLGQGTTGMPVASPVQVPGIDDAIGLAAGGFHSCAIRSDNTLWCWGLDQNGQVGDGVSSSSVPAPTPVPGLADVVQVTAGDWYTCARTRAGVVSCWGMNTLGQTGNGATSPSSFTPAPVLALGPVVDVFSGDDTTCAFDDSGALWCWGDDSEGELADGAPGDYVTSAVLIAGVGGVLDVAIGRRHVCTLNADGHVSCWGRGINGQLGDGMLVTRDNVAQSQFACP